MTAEEILLENGYEGIMTFAGQTMRMLLSGYQMTTEQYMILT